ncbi:MAG: YcgN family cysteine cluster protein [Spongiibacter marinus]|uniref:YcgN family cysteine cluster protein n=1 Tax=Spongiibacter marinus TaxID=354246 RepID=UPI003C4D8082
MIASRHRPFWEAKSLAEMSDQEWEALCDGCGRCCLHKLEDEDSGEVYYTDVSCRLLDVEHIRCRDYPQRLTRVPGCLDLRESLPAFAYSLPSSCAYRQLHEGRPLEPWHPLISGDQRLMETLGVSVKGRCVSEVTVADDELEDHIIRWID